MAGWQEYTDTLDPVADCVEIMRTLTTYEFPWDMNQALSFALFRTFAVPGIGELLHRTGEFEQRCQKRYDDTALLLEQPIEHGIDTADGRSAIRRINQMHRAYDIADHEMRYTLSTFVVVPIRWINAYGKRRLTDNEVTAMVTYYQRLGRRMAIGDIPSDYAAFADLLDSYEAEHFDYTTGGRRVADATLTLLGTFYARPVRPFAGLFARALMDPPLRTALGYAAPAKPIVGSARAALRLRGRVLAHAPARYRPKRVRDLPWIRSNPDGYRIEDLGTFPNGCPHTRAAPGHGPGARTSATS